MKYSGIGFIIFGILVIAFPKIISYLVGALLILIGVNIFIFSNRFGKFSGKNQEPYVKFGNYKIYR